MKNLLLIICCLFIATSGFAQSQSINYKAIIKDGSGNLVANQSVTIQFAILQGAGTTNVYQETHTPTTDANGIIVLNIGEGSLEIGAYIGINWDSDDHYLNVQVDTGSGLVDLGTTQFMAVPYALSAGNVSGLETLDEGNGAGWRLIGRDAANYGNIGDNAVDLTSSQTMSSTSGATGDFSIAMGGETIASGHGSTALGIATKAEAMYSTSIGLRNIGGGNPTTWVGTDPIFEVGNGAFTGIPPFPLSNAFTILKNGTITAPSFDLAEITDDKSLITKEYADINLVGSGLEALDEGNGIGWRLKGQDSSNYGNLGDKAVDLTYSQIVSTTIGATGDFSTAMGIRTKASGDVSTAMGLETTASGSYSTAMGEFTVASGTFSTAMGLSTDAESYTSTAMGRYNVGGGTSDDWLETDPLFEIGNGADNSNKSNALTILKNGTITGPSFDISEITDDKALITKEYADTNLVGSGLEALDEGNGIGYGLIGRDPLDYGNIGEDAIDLSSSTSLSEARGATGLSSFASGKNTIASGDDSTAMGLITESSGDLSTAMGSITIASGYGSTAMGRATTASGRFSTAIGWHTEAESLSSVAIGSYNVGGGTADNWFPIDPLFEIGNGLDDVNRSNALTVLKNGKVGIGESNPSGFLEISSANNTNEPTVKLIHEGATGPRINFTNTEVTNGNLWTLYGDPNDTDASSVFNIFHPNAGNIIRIHGDGEVGINGVPNTEFHVYHGAAGGTDGFKLENTGSNNNWWRFYVVNSNANLNLHSKSQGGTSVGNFNDITGAYSATSDRRLKKDFKPLPFSWKNFMNLETLSYLYKAQFDDKRSLGLISQDVELIYPELVTHNTDDDVYHLNYSGFGVLAIKAVQELKSEVEHLKEENNILKVKLSKFEDLEARLSVLEANNASTEGIILSTKE